MLRSGRLPESCATICVPHMAVLRLGETSRQHRAAGHRTGEQPQRITVAGEYGQVRSVPPNGRLVTCSGRRRATVRSASSTAARSAPDVTSERRACWPGLADFCPERPCRPCCSCSAAGWPRSVEQALEPSLLAVLSHDPGDVGIGSGFEASEGGKPAVGTRGDRDTPRVSERLERNVRTAAPRRQR